MAYLLILLLLSNFAMGSELLSMDSFLSQVREKSLELKVENGQREALYSQSRGLKLEAPMLEVSRMQEGDASALGFAVEQSIPYPGKLFADKNSREEMAKAGEHKYLASEKSIVENAKIVFIDYWINVERIKVLNSKKTAFKKHLAIIRAGEQSNSLAGIHALKVENTLDLVENELTLLKQEVDEKRAEINYLLNQDATALIPEPATPPFTEIPTSVGQAHEEMALAQELKSADEDLSLAKKSWLPDFKLKYAYREKNEMGPQTQEVAVGISLPFVFPGERDASVDQMAAQKMKVQYEYEKTQRQLMNTRQVLLKRASVLKSQWQQFQNVLIPRAHQRHRQLGPVALRNMESLDTHFDIYEDLAQLQMQALELRKQYEITVSEYNKISSINEGRDE